MKPLEHATEFFQVPIDELQEFSVEDVFNGGLKLDGVLCRHGDHRYGAMIIYQIDGIPYRPQVVWGTPKLHYPFDKLGRFKWPAVTKINCYEKLDGTNVVAYRYEYKDRVLVSYKTRLQPVLRSGKFGAFREMWEQLLNEKNGYSGIPALVRALGINLSFEMWGAQNKHLICYDKSLETTLLFGIAGQVQPAVVDPEHLIDRLTPEGRRVFETLQSGKGIPASSARVECTASMLTDLTSFYKKLQGDAQGMNKKNDFGIEGTEGWVFYCHRVDGGVEMIKCKPADVEKIHFAAGGIDAETIRATCRNAFETTDTPTIELIEQMLREEFEPRAVEARHQRSIQILEEVHHEMVFRREVLEKYRALGVTLVEDKRTVMRALSQHFPRTEMKYVYFIVANA